MKEPWLRINTSALPYFIMSSMVKKSCAEVRRQCYKQEKSGSYDEIKISFMIVLLKYEEKSNFGKKVAYERNHDLMFYHVSLLYHLKQLQRSVLLYLAGYRLSLPCLVMNCLVFILSLEVVSIKRFSLQHEKEHANIPNLVSEGSVAPLLANMLATPVNEHPSSAKLLLLFHLEAASS